MPFPTTMPKTVLGMLLALAAAGSAVAQTDDATAVHEMLDRIEKGWETHDIEVLRAECHEDGLTIMNLPGHREAGLHCLFEGQR